VTLPSLGGPSTVVDRPPTLAAATSPTGPLAGARIVVVDDDRDSQELLTALFRSAGAAVGVAGSVTEAMRLIVDQRPGVIVTDVGLPEEDGVELIALVRALRDPALAATPMVALTAYAPSPEETRARGAGFDAYLTKPVEPAELVTAVARALARGRPS
jgi:CheY-like chemotaxis protein